MKQNQSETSPSWRLVKPRIDVGSRRAAICAVADAINRSPEKPLRFRSFTFVPTRADKNINSTYGAIRTITDDNPDLELRVWVRFAKAARRPPSAAIKRVLNAAAMFEGVKSITSAQSMREMVDRVVGRAAFLKKPFRLVALGIVPDWWDWCTYILEVERLGLADRRRSHHRIKYAEA